MMNLLSYIIGNDHLCKMSKRIKRTPLGMKSTHKHVIPVILCEAKTSACNIIDPHDSLNIPMKHYVFGMGHAMQFTFQNPIVHFRAIRKI